MKILITGAHGLVGSALSEYLVAQGHEVKPLRRVEHAEMVEADNVTEPCWHIASGQLNFAGFEPQAIVHLAGESIAQGRWCASKKQRIMASRVDSTQLLCKAIANMKLKPEVLLSASAIGFYGHRGDELLDESSEIGQDFVSEVSRNWEAASQGVAQHGVRLVNLRTGLVLSAKGGALGQMLLPFKLGLGGAIASGKQYMSWISIDDMVRAIEFLMLDQQVSGAVNLVTDSPVTNRQFSQTLASSLSRPCLFTTPAFVLRLMFGEMADELLLSSTKVTPKVLLERGFNFQHPQLEQALFAVLNA